MNPKQKKLLTRIIVALVLFVIIEVAARNLSLKRMGYSAAHELDRRLNEMIAQNSSNGDGADS